MDGLMVEGGGEASGSSGWNLCVKEFEICSLL